MSRRPRSGFRRGAVLAATLLAFVAAALAPRALAGWKDVPVLISIPAKVKTEPGEKVLVALFRANDHDSIDVGLELARWGKREIGRGTALAVLDVPPPPIPEQRPDKLAQNYAFWKRLGEDFEADLIVAGIATYTSDDRSGFVSEDVVSPVTGQTVRRQRFAERRGYQLRVQVLFLKGDNGALLHSESWQQLRIVDSQQGEELQTFYDLLEGMKPNLLAALTPTKMQEPRSVWID